MASEAARRGFSTLVLERGPEVPSQAMTADELKELACLEFQADLFMQSFCHTAAYPKAADVKMHISLPAFMIERKGVALKPGDGVIHSWLNRLLLPDTMGTGGDSHTRFPIGLSFPAGSGLVAFAGALGFMPLDMPVFREAQSGYHPSRRRQCDSLRGHSEGPVDGG